ncbi:MAG: helix-turn-helix transcriptional regulator [Clostridia bacterium]|nr:helix-turn-helix transcriptional regulator [Clostridia bacterium]
MNTLRISACIRSYRQEHAMSQTVFGELFGVTAQAVSKWERELSCPDIVILPEIARVLGVSVGYLLGENA